jgi:hypothetical protein
MYGTIARLKVKPGALDKISNMEDERHPEGYVGTFVYQSDKDPNEIWMAVLFEDKTSYHANANDPTQDQEYQEFRKLLNADPEWHDGEIVYASETIKQPC